MPSASERHLVAQIAAHSSWANTEDRSARTASARAALGQKFLDEANGDPARAQHLRKAYYARLALKSAKARRAARSAAVTRDESRSATTAPPPRKRRQSRSQLHPTCGLVLRCAWLRAHSNLLYDVDPGGLLSAQLRDFADLLEVAEAQAWFR
jgi:hypothetical protein